MTPLWHERGAGGLCHRRAKGGQDAKESFSLCSVDFLSLLNFVTNLRVSPPRGIGFEDTVLILSLGFLPDALTWRIGEQRHTASVGREGKGLLSSLDSWVLAQGGISGEQSVSLGLLDPGWVISGCPGMF